MHRIIGSLIVVANLVSAGCGAPDGAGPERAARAALTATDVDVAPECQGILDYANTASYAALDAYLPSNLANNIVAARAVAPFARLADLSSVSGMGEYRLQQVLGAARAGAWIGPSCVGIFDELAVSADDEAAMVTLVNAISSTELHGVLPYAWNGAVNLLAARPVSSVAQISATSGIGPVSLRNIRNAATLSRPFETLAAAVNALHREAQLQRHFDWYAMLSLGQYRLNTDFRVPPTASWL